MHASPLLYTNDLLQQRNGRKYWTIVEGLNTIDNLSLKDFVKVIKKNLCCNGSIHTDSDNSENIFVQFQGDHRNNIKDLLIKKYNISDERILIHGY